MNAIATHEISLHTPSLWARLVEMGQRIARMIEARRPLGALERRLYTIAEDFGTYVLDASDVAHARARLYEVARDERLLRWEFEVLQHIDLTDSPLQAHVVEDRLTQALGQTHLVRECARLLAARVHVLGQVFSSLEQVEVGEDAARALQYALLDFRSPPVLRSLLEETLAGEAAMVGLLANLMDPERWPCDTWLRLALLEQVRLASISHLRLLSMVPGIEIPDDILPPEERLEPASLDAERVERIQFVLPPELRVHPDYADALVDALQEHAPPSAGVRALFED